MTNGVHEGTEQIRSGTLLPDDMPAYNIDPDYKLNSGEFILPQGTVKAVGAAPVAVVPSDITIDWIAMGCTPFWAFSIATERSEEDFVNEKRLPAYYSGDNQRTNGERGCCQTRQFFKTLSALLISKF